MSNKELGSATFCRSDDAWVTVNGITVAFFSKYNDYAFTLARDLVKKLNNDPELKQKYYDEAMEKLNEKNNKN